MDFQNVGQLVAVFTAGVGMTLAGGLNLLLPRAAGWVRVAAGALLCGGVFGGAWVLGQDTRTAVVAALVTAVAVGLCTVGGSAVSAGTAFLGAARRPAVRWGLLALLGCGTATGSIFAYCTQSDAALDLASDELLSMTEPPPTRVAEAIQATTDRGTVVPLKEATDPRAAEQLAGLEERSIFGSAAKAHVIRRQPADDRSNCHGWVFTGGRFWVMGALVELILNENGYQPVTDPHPGDLVVYRDNGHVTHTALVRYVTPGMPVVVEGKWGVAGVYLHAVEESIYGPHFTYYRSPRAGHLLAGTGGPSTDPLLVRTPVR